MGFLGHPFLETPNIDSLARNGAYLPNAVVTTSLCSPSRASMLTGLYAHNHGVVDNNHPVRGDLVFFPQLLQRAGYRTGFFGKWHMGGGDAGPQRGFDRWVKLPNAWPAIPTRRSGWWPSNTCPPISWFPCAPMRTGGCAMSWPRACPGCSSGRCSGTKTARSGSWRGHAGRHLPTTSIRFPTVGELSAHMNELSANVVELPAGADEPSASRGNHHGRRRYR